MQSSSAFSAVPPARVVALIGTALAAGHVTETGGRLYAVDVAAPALAAEPAAAGPTARPLRAVMLDVESIVKTTSEEPFTNKRIYQIGLSEPAPTLPGFPPNRSSPVGLSLPMSPG